MYSATSGITITIGFIVYISNITKIVFVYDSFVRSNMSVSVFNERGASSLKRPIIIINIKIADAIITVL